MDEHETMCSVLAVLGRLVADALLGPLPCILGALMAPRALFDEPPHRHGCFKAPTKEECRM